ADARADAGAQQIPRAGHRRESAGQSRAETRAHHVRRANRGRAAVVRFLHERRDDVSLFVRAVSRQPAEAHVRVRGLADSASGAPAEEIKMTITPLSRDGRVRVVVATTVLLSFISFWRAAAIVLADLGSTAFYVGGIVEQAVGKSAPWFILVVMIFS